MNPDLLAQAEKLAARPYTVGISLDETTEGASVYVAYHPELKGCLGQGLNMEEAVANLDEARVDYIHSLLDDNLPVPEPEALETSTTSSPIGETLVLSNRKVEAEPPKHLFEAAVLTLEYDLA